MVITSKIRIWRRRMRWGSQAWRRAGEHLLTIDISSFFSLLEERDRKISKCHFSFLVEVKASGDAGSPRGRLCVLGPVIKLFFGICGRFWVCTKLQNLGFLVACHLPNLSRVWRQPRFPYCQQCQRCRDRFCPRNTKLLSAILALFLITSPLVSLASAWCSYNLTWPWGKSEAAQAALSARLCSQRNKGRFKANIHLFLLV